MEGLICNVQISKQIIRISIFGQISSLMFRDNLNYVLFFQLLLSSLLFTSKNSDHFIFFLYAFLNSLERK